jgi:hypothetical protein
MNVSEAVQLMELGDREAEQGRPQITKTAQLLASQVAIVASAELVPVLLQMFGDLVEVQRQIRDEVACCRGLLTSILLNNVSPKKGDT